MGYFGLIMQKDKKKKIIADLVSAGASGKHYKRNIIFNRVAD